MDFNQLKKRRNLNSGAKTDPNSFQTDSTQPSDSNSSDSPLGKDSALQSDAIVQEDSPISVDSLSADSNAQKERDATIRDNDPIQEIDPNPIDSVIQDSIHTKDTHDSIDSSILGKGTHISEEPISILDHSSQDNSRDSRDSHEDQNSSLKNVAAAADGIESSNRAENSSGPGSLDRTAEEDRASETKSHDRENSLPPKNLIPDPPSMSPEASAARKRRNRLKALKAKEKSASSPDSRSEIPDPSLFKKQSLAVSPELERTGTYVDSPSKKELADSEEVLSVSKTGNLVNLNPRPGDKWNGRKTSSKRRYPGDSRKIKDSELSIFKNLNFSRMEVFDGLSGTGYLRKPIGEIETPKERRERELRMGRALLGEKASARNSRLRSTYKHVETLEFLAIMRYATTRQISKMFSEAEITTYKRMKYLEEIGLVNRKNVYMVEDIWLLTKMGMLFSGYDLNVIPYNRVQTSTFNHRFGINHIAACLWGGSVNILDEEEYPRKNRLDRNGNPRYGDLIVSEFQIQSALARIRGSMKMNEYRPILSRKIKNLWAEWEENGGIEFGPSPEMISGNEWLWGVYPPKAVNRSFHVPDLVVKRDRNPDGSPESIAIELELNNKNEQKYYDVMNSFKFSENIYKEVVWICDVRGIGRKIQKVSEELGIEDRVRTIPILDSEGERYRGEMWQL